MASGKTKGEEHMKEEWLFPNAVVPVDVETTAALVAEIKRLIDVVGGMALAQVEQEPVAWMTINEYGEEDDIHYENPEGHLLEGWTYKPLYTHAPTVQPKKEPRQWVVLEAEDLAQIESDEFWQIRNHMAIALAVEAKLKEKNR